MGTNILILTPHNAVAMARWSDVAAFPIVCLSGLSLIFLSSCKPSCTIPTQNVLRQAAAGPHLQCESPSLFEVDAVGASVGVLVSLEVIQGHPKFAKDGVSKFF